MKRIVIRKSSSWYTKSKVFVWVCVDAWRLCSKWLTRFCSLASGPGNWHTMSVKQEAERGSWRLSGKEIQRDGGRDRHKLSSHIRYSTINCYLELHTHTDTHSFVCSVANKRVIIAGRTLLQQCHLSAANEDSTPVTARRHTSTESQKDINMKYWTRNGHLSRILNQNWQ